MLSPHKFSLTNRQLPKGGSFVSSLDAIDSCSSCGSIWNKLEELSENEAGSVSGGGCPPCIQNPPVPRSPYPPYVSLDNVPKVVI
ncbi:hypothetical protein NIES4074_09980 [Cylindrospermum sp. NIES-4074]|nr:hypothetical protein NIES4074_09980 [Cylindrospermum sp. NIES-4074]